MKRAVVSLGALVGGLLTAPMIVLMYLGDLLAGLPFAPFDLFNWISRLLPGPVITFGIDLMIDTLLFLGVDVADTAKLAEQGMAISLFFAIGVVSGAIFFLILDIRRIRVDRFTGLVIGAIFGLPIVTISIALGTYSANPVVSFLWLLALFLAWGWALSWSYRRLFAEQLAVPAGEGEAVEGEVRRAQRIDRRQFLIYLGGSAAAITVVGSGVGAMLSRQQQQAREEALDDSMAHLAEGPEGAPFPNANDPVTPAPGTRPEYTPLKDHYKVFIELEPTEIDGDTWQLPVTGMVDNPLMLTLDDLRNNYPARDQYVTLSCISGRIATTLISTTFWTGTSVQNILADAQVQEGARYMVITSGDGYYETVDLELIAAEERIMFCYGWDGNPLPVDHGFPLRIWIPDRFGMKQPKWITGIEITDEYREGYWVERGWDELAQVKTTSVIDTVAVDAVIENGDQRLVPIGGIAFSGARGISKVELRVDGGEWQEAQLRSPLSETTWVIWRYDWPFQEGRHTFEVRCAEADGAPQIEEVQPNRPSGATGLHSREVDV